MVVFEDSQQPGVPQSCFTPQVSVVWSWPWQWHWTWGGTSSLWGWRSTGTGCPGRLWSLLLWRYSRPAWTRSCSAYCRWPCFGTGVGLDDPQRSLPSPTILWFCDSVNCQLTCRWQNWCSKRLTGSQRSLRLPLFLTDFLLSPWLHFISSSQHEAVGSSFLFLGLVLEAVEGQNTTVFSSSEKEAWAQVLCSGCPCCTDWHGASPGQLALSEVIPGHSSRGTISQEPFPVESMNDAIWF